MVCGGAATALLTLQTLWAILSCDSLHLACSHQGTDCRGKESLFILRSCHGEYGCQADKVHGQGEVSLSHPLAASVYACPESTHLTSFPLGTRRA